MTIATVSPVPPIVPIVPIGVRRAAPAGRFASWLLQGLLIALLISSALDVLAQSLLPVPALSARVIDQTGTLSATQLSELDAKLAALEASKGSQLVVLLVPTTAPEDIASFANRVANEWKIGRRDVGDGVLLIVAKNDRQLRIEVAKTLEGAIPDLAAKRIIDGAITPGFKQGNFAGGLRAGVDQIAALVAGEALPQPKSKPGSGMFNRELGDFGDLLVFMVFALPIGAGLLRAALGRKLGAVAVGAGVGVLGFLFSASIWIAVLAAAIALAYALFGGLAVPGGSLGRRRGSGGFTGTGGWGGGGGGGGFGSGGGGNFGGGGASGRW